MPHRRPSRAHLLSAAVLAALVSTSLHAATLNVTWDGTTANWTDSLHWGLASGFPDNNLSPGVTYGVNVSFGTIALNVSPTVDQFSITGRNASTLSGASTLTVTQKFIISSGTDPTPDAQLMLDASLIAASSATSSINGHLLLTDRATLTNNGTLTLAQGYMQGQGGKGQFTNNGAIVTTTGATIYGLNFVNNGSIDIKSGTLQVEGSGFNLNTGANSTGPVSVEAGASFSVLNYSFTASTITGAGNVVDNGNLTVTSTYSPTGNTTIGYISTLTLGGATPAVMAGALSLAQYGILQTSQSLTFHGSSTWSGSVIGTTAATKLTLQGGAAISANPTLAYTAAELDNASSFAGGTTLTLSDSASLTNAGTLTLGDGTLTSGAAKYGHTGLSSFINTGQIIFNGINFGFGIVDPANTLTFLNKGAITINTGSFTIDAPDAGSTGTITVASGAYFNVGRGRTLDFGSRGAATLAGAGSVYGVGATITLPRDVVFSGRIAYGTVNIVAPRDPDAGVSFAPAALTPDSLNISTDIAFNQQVQVFDTLTIASGTTEFAGFSSPILNNLIIDGTVFFEHTPTVSGAVTLAGTLGGGTLPGLHGGTLSTSSLSNSTLQTAGAWAQTTGATVTLYNAASFTNSGSLTLGAGAIVLLDTASFTNTGTLTVNASSDAFTLQSTSANASFSNTGRISISAGTLTLSPASAPTLGGKIDLAQIIHGDRL